MQFDIPEEDGIGRFIVKWQTKDGKEQKDTFDYWHDAITQYHHLKRIGLVKNIRVVVLLLPLPTIVPDEGE